MGLATLAHCHIQKCPEYGHHKLKHQIFEFLVAIYFLMVLKIEKEEELINQEQ